jgi:hypothetical protein
MTVYYIRLTSSSIGSITEQMFAVEICEHPRNMIVATVQFAYDDETDDVTAKFSHLERCKITFSVDVAQVPLKMTEFEFLGRALQALGDQIKPDDEFVTDCLHRGDVVFFMPEARASRF